MPLLLLEGMWISQGLWVNLLLFKLSRESLSWLLISRLWFKVLQGTVWITRPSAQFSSTIKRKVTEDWPLLLLKDHSEAMTAWSLWWLRKEIFKSSSPSTKTKKCIHFDHIDSLFSNLSNFTLPIDQNKTKSSYFI